MLCLINDTIIQSVLRLTHKIHAKVTFVDKNRPPWKYRIHAKVMFKDKKHRGKYGIHTKLTFTLDPLHHSVCQDSDCNRFLLVLA